MIRAEARTALWRWRDVLVGLGILALALWAVLGAYGILHWLGWLGLALGAAFVWNGWQRLRFHRDPDGPGVVSVTEGQISYYGPLSGGAVARSNLTSLAYDPTGKPAHWVLGHDGGPDLHIPVTASGAEALFDFFSSLPGLRMDQLLRVTTGSSTASTRLWQRDSSATVTQFISRSH
ncbi:hypothetical protein ACM25N_10830 [Roseovarius sp. C7]|uniref:hypothetical protein n=1 Tax=Roseovarius sp. C7 TaxID=3398643 RepID=UPI0039F7242A